MIFCGSLSHFKRFQRALYEFKGSLRGSLEGFSKCLKTPQSCLRVAYMLPRRKVPKEFQDVHVV